MDVYLSAVSDDVFNEFCNTEIYANLKILESFFGIQKHKDLKKYITTPAKFLLDSGAFSFLGSAKKIKIDWDVYLENYADFINKYEIENFFELDIDSLVGLDKIEKMRERLEVLTGKQPIPVWHKNRGKDYFVEMCKKYKYVALGGLALKEIPILLYEKHFPWFISVAHKFGTKIHGLGYTSSDGLKKYKFDSVDSSTWIVGARYGNLCKFLHNEKKIIQIHKKELRVKDNKNLNFYNFAEWARFSKYAEFYL